MPIIVEVKYRLKPGTRDELLTFVLDNVVNTRLEPGNLAYAHYASLEHGQEMFVFEKWESEAHLKAHLQAPHYLAFSQRRMPMLESYEYKVHEAQLAREGHQAPRPGNGPTEST